MARTKRSVPQATSPTPVVINGHSVPLTPFYLYFRKKILDTGYKYDDDQIDEILQLEPSLVNPNADPNSYFFFGLCSEVFMNWNRLSEDERSKYADDYEKLLKHFEGKKRKTSGQAAEEISLCGDVKCGLELVYDEFSHVCEFLNVSSLINLGFTCKRFQSHYRKLISTLLSSNQYVEYFKRRKFEPRLKLFLSDNLLPELKELKDSLDIQMVIDFKVMDRQPGGNYDDFITRQVVKLNSNTTKYFKSKVRNYDDTIYDNDIVISVERDPTLLRNFILSLCKLVSQTEQSLPLIFKPNLTHQYIFTSVDKSPEYDDPHDFSQIEISLYDRSEKILDFVKVSVLSEMFNVSPIENSKTACELIENTYKFCGVESFASEVDCLEVMRQSFQN